jgi:hypothetical protein
MITIVESVNLEDAERNWRILRRISGKYVGCED